MKTDIWLPFYVADYLADTTHLSTQEHGAYVLLLLAAWRKGGFLKNDDEQLARITKLQIQEWLKIKTTILEFFSFEGDKIFQKRISKEYEKSFNRKMAAFENGKKGGRPPKNNPTHNPEITQPFSELKPEVNPRKSSSSSPSSSHKDTETESVAFSDFWEMYPNKKNIGDAQRAWRQLEITEDLLSDIFEGLEKAIDSQEWDWEDGRFVPYPAKWLEKKGWLDEYKAKKVTRDQSLWQTPHPLTAKAK